MKICYDFSRLDWNLSGWTPNLWQFQKLSSLTNKPSIGLAIPAKVPGSVQFTLRANGLLPDWNEGLNARLCEWVENRQWLYEAVIPDDWIHEGKVHRLRCLGLDYKGSVYINETLVGEFAGTHIPHTFDLTPHLKQYHNVLQILFDLPPRWLGQFGYTSRITDWKARFNYTWDWVPRLVQVGIWDDIFFEVTDGQEINTLRCVADVDVPSATGMLMVVGMINAIEGAVLRVSLSKEGAVIREEQLPASQFTSEGLIWEGLSVELWWPNLSGPQPLYICDFTLLDKKKQVLDQTSYQVGFRNIVWRPCEGTSEGTDPWLCVVNGQPIFLQGVNFPPILPNFADVTEGDYRKRLELYSYLGMNTLRVNGCGILEKETFYNLCDELGLLVWQDFPLSSSGLENVPPDDDHSIHEMAQIARSIITRRQHHPSLLLWCGGNELLDQDWRPLDGSHPMLVELKKVVEELDPLRRFLVTSPSGPRMSAQATDFGKGLHWDVHGPYTPYDDSEAWLQYWKDDDALFRSELATPGAAPVELIEHYRGDCNLMPVDPANPFWRITVDWWVEAAKFKAEYGHSPQSLKDYVDWSQHRQLQALVMGVKACKDRFPGCGGVLLWCGHDCFPCPTNCSIVDYHGDPKPAALALAKIYRGELMDEG